MHHCKDDDLFGVDPVDDPVRMSQQFSDVGLIVLGNHPASARKMAQRFGKIDKTAQRGFCGAGGLEGDEAMDSGQTPPCVLRESHPHETNLA